MRVGASLLTTGAVPRRARRRVRGERGLHPPAGIGGGWVPPAGYEAGRRTRRRRLSRSAPRGKYAESHRGLPPPEPCLSERGDAVLGERADALGGGDAELRGALDAVGDAG